MKQRFTLREALTALVVLVVIGAIAVPMWGNHQLRGRRQDAIKALHAVQAAQDEYFGKHARYADEAQLNATAPGVMPGKTASMNGRYQLTMRKSDDDLSYTAIARVVPREGEPSDTRCVEIRIDQNGRRFAVDDAGVDRSADCWR
jgi:Tfp pilus assembly protein PilE